MKKGFSIFIIIGLILGIVGGICFPEAMNSLSFLGTIYINLLKFIIVPIIFSSIMVTVFNLKKENGKVVLKSIVIFIIMFVVTFLITSLIVFLLKPGLNYSFDVVEWQDYSSLSFSNTIINLFPSNIVTMFQNNSLFSTIIFSFICGIVASKVKNGNKVIEVMDGFKNIFSKILEYIMYLTPIGVFSLIGSTIANYGNVILGVGAKYILIAYLCSVIILILVMILPVWIFAKINPFTYIKKVYKVWIVTFTTCSSMATLPYTIRTCNEEFKIPSKITDVVVPLGCTIHMCGGAVSFALLGIFCSQLYGLEITFFTYFTMLVSALLINMAAPGIPNGGVVIGASYLSILGLPLTFIGFYSGVYKFLDMSYTTLNVTGDITANILVNVNKE